MATTHGHFSCDVYTPFPPEAKKPHTKDATGKDVHTHAKDEKLPPVVPHKPAKHIRGKR